MNAQVKEAYMALAVSILTKSTPEQAFEKLSNDYDPGIHYNKSITNKDLEDMISMKKSGETWREIGEVFGVTLYTAFARVKRYKKNKEGGENWVVSQT